MFQVPIRDCLIFKESIVSFLSATHRMRTSVRLAVRETDSLMAEGIFQSLGLGQG